MTTQEAYRKKVAQKTAEIIAYKLMTKRKEVFDNRKQVAAEMGVTESSILRIEKGHFRLRVELMIEYCLLLHLNPVTLLSTSYQEAKEKVQQ